MIEPKDLEDFRGLVRRFGHDPNHFEVRELPQPATGFPDLGRQQISVRHVPSGARRVYRLSRGEKWLPKLREDLRRGRFSRT